MALTDFEELQKQGLPLPEIVANLATKYNYDLNTAVRQGKDRETILRELIEYKPVSNNIISALTRGFAKGVLAETPGLIGSALTALPVTAPVGETLQKFAQGQREKIDRYSPTVTSTPTRWIEEAGSMLAPSLGIPAGVGAGAGILAKLLGAKKYMDIGVKAAEIGAPTIYGLAQGKSAYEQSIKEGIPEETALPNAIAQGLIEAFGEYFGTKAFGRLLGLEGGKAEPFPKRLGKTLLVETGTEAGQQAGEDISQVIAEKASGLNPSLTTGELISRALGVIPPTAIMTLLTGALPGHRGAIPVVSEKKTDLLNKEETKPVGQPPAIPTGVLTDILLGQSPKKKLSPEETDYIVKNMDTLISGLTDEHLSKISTLPEDIKKPTLTALIDILHGRPPSVEITKPVYSALEDILFPEETRGETQKPAEKPLSVERALLGYEPIQRTPEQLALFQGLFGQKEEPYQMPISFNRPPSGVIPAIQQSILPLRKEPSLFEYSPATGEYVSVRPMGMGQDLLSTLANLSGNYKDFISRIDRLNLEENPGLARELNIPEIIRNYGGLEQFYNTIKGIPVKEKSAEKRVTPAEERPETTPVREPIQQHITPEPVKVPAIPTVVSKLKSIAQKIAEADSLNDAISNIPLETITKKEEALRKEGLEGSKAFKVISAIKKVKEGVKLDENETNLLNSFYNTATERYKTSAITRPATLSNINKGDYIIHKSYLNTLGTETPDSIMRIDGFSTEDRKGKKELMANVTVISKNGDIEHMSVRTDALMDGNHFILTNPARTTAQRLINKYEESKKRESLPPKVSNITIPDILKRLSSYRTPEREFVSEVAKTKENITEEITAKKQRLKNIFASELAPANEFFNSLVSFGNKTFTSMPEESRSQIEDSYKYHIQKLKEAFPEIDSIQKIPDEIDTKRTVGSVASQVINTLKEAESELTDRYTKDINISEEDALIVDTLNKALKSFEISRKGGGTYFDTLSSYVKNTEAILSEFRRLESAIDRNIDEIKQQINSIQKVPDAEALIKKATLLKNLNSLRYRKAYLTHVINTVEFNNASAQDIVNKFPSTLKDAYYSKDKRFELIEAYETSEGGGEINILKLTPYNLLFLQEYGKPVVAYKLNQTIENVFNEIKGLSEDNVIDNKEAFDKVARLIDKLPKTERITSNFNVITDTLNMQPYFTEVFTGKAQEKLNASPVTEVAKTKRVAEKGKKKKEKDIKLYLDAMMLNPALYRYFGVNPVTDALKSNIHRELERHITRILGSPMHIEIIDSKAIASLLKKEGITADELRMKLRLYHGIETREENIENLVPHILGAYLTTKNFSHMIFLNSEHAPAEVVRAGFHEIMEVLLAQGRVSKGDISILKREFETGERKWSENVADAFADYMIQRGDFEHIDIRQKNPVIERIFNTIRNFLLRVRNYLEGLGFRTSKDVFKELSGGMAQRPAFSRVTLNERLNLSATSKLLNTRNEILGIKDKIDSLLNGTKASLRDKRLSRFASKLIPPQWLDHPIIQSIFNATVDADETSSERMYSYLNPIMNEIEALDKKRYEALNKAVIDSDMSNTYFSEDILQRNYGLDKETILIYQNLKKMYDQIITDYVNTHMKNYINAVAEINDIDSTPLVSDIDSLITTLNMGIDEATKKYGESYKDTLEILMDVIPEMAKVRDAYKEGFYFPRVWEDGDIAVKVYEYAKDEKTGEPYFSYVWRGQTKQSVSRIKQETEASNMIKDIKKKLGKDFKIIELSKEDFEKDAPKYLEPNTVVIVKEDITKLPESLLQRATAVVGKTIRGDIRSVSLENLSLTMVNEYANAIVNRLTGEVSSDKDKKEVLEKLTKIVRDSFLETLKARSYASSRTIHRKTGYVSAEGVLSGEKSILGGYKTDLKDVTKSYTVAMSRSMARAESISEINRYISSPDIQKELLKDRNLFDFVLRYIDGVMSPSNIVSRHARAVRSLAATWFLGGRVSSAAIQLSQIFVTAAPELATFENVSNKEDLLGYKGRAESLAKVGTHITRQGQAILRLTKAMNDIISGNLSEEEKAIIEDGIKKDIVMSQFIQSVMGDADKVLGKTFSSLSRKSMILFQKAEELSRKVGLIAAFRLARRKGLNVSEAESFAIRFVQEAFHIYKSINRPLIALGNKGIAPLVSVPLSLRGYQLNYIGWVYKALKNQYGKVYADKLVFSAVYMMILGGLWAIPFGKEIIEYLSKLTGIPLKRKITRMLSMNSEFLGKSLEYGILAPIFGIDLSNSIRLEMLPQELSASGFADFALGVWSGMGTKATRAKYAVETWQNMKAIESIAPSAVEGLIKGIRYFTEPLATLQGKKIVTPEGKPVKVPQHEAIFQVLGFRPVTLSETQDYFFAEKTIQNYYRDKANRIYTRLKTAKDYGEIMDIMKDINEYNQKVSKYRGGVPFITATSIMRVLKNAQGTPSKLYLYLKE